MNLSELFSSRRPNLLPPEDLLPNGLPVRLPGIDDGTVPTPALLRQKTAPNAEPIVPPSTDQTPPRIRFVADSLIPAIESAQLLTIARIAYTGMPEDLGLFAARLTTVCLVVPATVRAFEAGANLVDYLKQRGQR